MLLVSTTNFTRFNINFYCDFLLQQACQRQGSSAVAGQARLLCLRPTWLARGPPHQGAALSAATPHNSALFPYGVVKWRYPEAQLYPLQHLTMTRPSFSPEKQRRCHLTHSILKIGSQASRTIRIGIGASLPWCNIVSCCDDLSMGGARRAPPVQEAMEPKRSGLPDFFQEEPQRANSANPIPA